MAIGGVWAPGTWADECWAEGTWADFDDSSPSPGPAASDAEDLVQRLADSIIAALTTDVDIKIQVVRRYGG